MSNQGKTVLTSATRQPAKRPLESPAASRDDWLRAVGRALKGSTFEQAATADGIAVGPLYDAGDMEAIDGARTARPWSIVAILDHPDATSAAEQAHEDLSGGAQELELALEGSRAARGFGLPVSASALTTVLERTLDHDFGLRLAPSPDLATSAQALTDALEGLGLSAEQSRISWGLDPLATGSSRGEDKVEADEVVAPLVGALLSKGFAGPLLLADGRPWHEAGASEAQEIAFIAAALAGHLRSLGGMGVAKAEAPDLLEAAMSSTVDQFMSIVKLRALRLVWRRLLDCCGLPAVPLRIHAETSWRMQTRLDPWGNILRATVAAFSAGVGGADSIAVLPYTQALGLPDAAARRIARNTHHVLLEEAQVRRVADPGAGSGAIQALTLQLAETAWTLLQSIERHGGLMASLRSGHPQDLIATLRSAAEDDVASGRIAIVGANLHPPRNEVSPSVIAPSNPSAAASSAASAIGLAPGRLTESFDRIVERVQAIEARGGSQPSVFLAHMGGAKDLQFIEDLFAAGGIHCLHAAEGSIVAPSLDTVTDAYRDSSAPAACICGRAEILLAPAQDASKPGGTLAEELSRRLSAAGCRAVFLAAKPDGEMERLLQNGIAGYIHEDADRIDLLTTALDAHEGS